MAIVIKPASEMSTIELISFLETLNQAYRNGRPIVEDDTYDYVYLAELRRREPTHPFLNKVEPELINNKNKVRHSTPMLSTEKAYTQAEVNAFVKRVKKAANEIGLSESDIEFRITPKLDGVAARYENGILVTRGNGLLGNDITHNLARGVVPVGGENSGTGEVVITKHYFNENLSEEFSHPRNFIAGLVSSDVPNELAVEALQDKVVHFVAYTTLVAIKCLVGDLSQDIGALCARMESTCIYPTDGSIIDVMNEELREVMGATSHHNNWQIAKKTKGETAAAKVKGVTWQTGRTGRVTPVINIEPTRLSGAEISNITGHHAGNIKNLNIGVGATVEFIRSGEVIPKLLGIIKTGKDAIIPSECPSCFGKLVIRNDFLVCTAKNCTAQNESRLVHFFNTLGNIDLFGPKTIKVLIENGITELEAIYQLKVEDFTLMGFGPKQSENLADQLLRSRTDLVEDWRFLAAFGIHHLGKGDSRKLLQSYRLEELNKLTSEDIITVSGFGEITAHKIPEGIKERWHCISALLSLGFNLQREDVIDLHTPIAGKYIVFSGAMKKSREKMKLRAHRLGAVIQATVNKKTDWLVIGNNVGESKITKAKSLGTKVITETEYLEMIGDKNVH